LKWLRNGAVLGALPFTVFYVIPFAFGSVPSALQGTAVLSLIFVPLTWAYAIIRYRLMDVDVIFQQGYVYTVAALAVLGVIYGLIFALGRIDDLSPAAVLVLVLIATFVFQPIRDYLQQVLDRHIFYKDSYDYRLTLVEFAREISSETDVDHMLDAIGERLLQTLAVRHVCFFLRCDERSEFRLDRIKGHTLFDLDGRTLDLAFLAEEPERAYLFFESPKRAGGAIAELDCSYYVPCRVRGRTIAWIGVSRSLNNDFLSSDDLGLLVALSGSAGIAIENARLYRSLERKASEYERLKEFSENIVESINVGILAADLDDRVESWNSRMEDLTGIARETAVGRPLRAVLPRELAERLSAVRGQDGIHHLDKVRLPTWVHSQGSANGSRREAIVNVAVAPLFSREAAEIGRLIIFDDITDRSELERRLVQADKLSSVGLLAAGVAHEVNTPLAVISAYAQMLAKQVDGDEQKAKLLEKIAKQTFRASEIVNSLLNFSRTSSVDFADVEIGRVIREVTSLVEHQFERAGVAVQIIEEDAVPAVRGNAGKLQQVFLNLFLNARDAMEAGGTLSIRIGLRDTAVSVEVSDTGKGIPADVLPRIFDPFFTTKGARKGTGLGLSVTYGIVQEHGGTIEADSRPEHGTRFVLSFPSVAGNATVERTVSLTHA
jgi:PAS domain S-box-containing protein